MGKVARPAISAVTATVVVVEVAVHLLVPLRPPGAVRELKKPVAPTRIAVTRKTSVSTASAHSLRRKLLAEEHCSRRTRCKRRVLK